MGFRRAEVNWLVFLFALLGLPVPDHPKGEKGRWESLGGATHYTVDGSLVMVAVWCGRKVGVSAAVGNQISGMFSSVGGDAYILVTGENNKLPLLLIWKI